VLDGSYHVPLAQTVKPLAVVSFESAEQSFEKEQGDGNDKKRECRGQREQKAERLWVIGGRDLDPQYLQELRHRHGMPIAALAPPVQLSGEHEQQGCYHNDRAP
jgi:hypothetical protein